MSFYLNTNKGTVQAELYLWPFKLEKHSKNKLETLRQSNEEIFHNIHFLLIILYTLPVSTSTPESTFFALKD